MIDLLKCPSKEWYQWAWAGPMGHGILKSPPVPAGKVLMLLQAGVGQQAGATGGYLQKASIAALRQTPSGPHRHDIVEGRSTNSTPLVAWTGIMWLMAGQQVSPRVSAIAWNEGITGSCSGWLLPEHELGGMNVVPLSMPIGMVQPDEQPDDHQCDVLTGWRLRLAKMKYKFGLFR